MKRRLSIFLLLACAAGFAFGLVQLFRLRFAAGDVYPAYSSLRSDPLGTMAFCESLERMPGLSVRRDFNAGNELPDGKATVYLHLAAPAQEWTALPDDLARAIEHFLVTGGRLAVTFFPETSQPSRRFFEKERDGSPKSEGRSLPIRLPHLRPHKRLMTLGATAHRCDNQIGKGRRPKEGRNPKPEWGERQVSDAMLSDFGLRASAFFRPSGFGLRNWQPYAAREAEKSKKSSKVRPDRQPHQTSLQKRWGVEFAFAALKPGEADAYQPARVVRQTDLPLPDTLDWHSATVFTNLDPSWRAIYARGTNPVVVERKFGSGTIVLATDSYFLSNEALRQDRHAALLAWLVGPARKVVFDEAHFGIVDESGVASLVRKYRLHGLAAGLLLLAGLFIWQNSVRFVPPGPAEREPDYVAGKEAAAGFVNLLRRNVAPRDVLPTCFAEWKKSFPQGARSSADRMGQAQAVLDADGALPRRQRDPVKTYQEICRILKTSGARDSKQL